MGHTATYRALIPEEYNKDTQRLWVFGYGSILWKTGFKYSRRKLGFISGFLRRFWQGNTTHRGTPTSPGRVATLVECESGEVWGAAYELVGREEIDAALDHLGVRECALGGYSTNVVTFKAHKETCDCSCSCIHSCDCLCDNDCECGCHNCEQKNSGAKECKCQCMCQTPKVLVFQATPENNLYMGPAPHEHLANEIVSSEGPSGHNVEYVLRLHDFMVEYFPEVKDNHLHGLVKSIHKVLHRRRISATSLMGNCKSKEQRKKDRKKTHQQEHQKESNKENLSLQTSK